MSISIFFKRVANTFAFIHGPQSRTHRILDRYAAIIDTAEALVDNVSLIAATSNSREKLDSSPYGVLADTLAQIRKRDPSRYRNLLSANPSLAKFEELNSLMIKNWGELESSARDQLEHHEVMNSQAFKIIRTPRTEPENERVRNEYSQKASKAKSFQERFSIWLSYNPAEFVNTMDFSTGFLQNYIKRSINLIQSLEEEAAEQPSHGLLHLDLNQTSRLRESLSKTLREIQSVRLSLGLDPEKSQYRHEYRWSH